jgi:hypothetical protein
MDSAVRVILYALSNSDSRSVRREFIDKFEARATRSAYDEEDRRKFSSRTTYFLARWYMSNHIGEFRA